MKGKLICVFIPLLANPSALTIFPGGSFRAAAGPRCGLPDLAEAGPVEVAQADPAISECAF